MTELQTRTVVIELTRHHIDDSLYDDFDMNPISLAISDFIDNETGILDSIVKLRGRSCTLNAFIGNKFLWRINMSKQVRRMYEDHLDGTLTPCVFELQLPDIGSEYTDLMSPVGMPDHVLEYRAKHA